MYPGDNPENGPARLRCPLACEGNIPFFRTVYLIVFKERGGSIRRTKVVHYTSGRAQSYILSSRQALEIISCKVARGQRAPRRSWELVMDDMVSMGALL